MHAAPLPAALRPSQPPKLQRFGGENDGGYLIDPRDLTASDGLLSFGVDRDWGFERNFLESKRVPIHAYDGGTSVRYLLRDIPHALSRRNVKWAVRNLLQTIDYLWFFSRPNVTHIRRFVGTARHAYRDKTGPTVPVAETFEAMRAAGSVKPFLKIDIEGAEYLMLEELIARADMTAALAIEFHDCDTRLDEISAFVRRYPLTLVHIHGNSGGGIGEGGIPCALELTFSSSAERTGIPPQIPHPLDQPNSDAGEIPLSFAAD